MIVAAILFNMHCSLLHDCDFDLYVYFLAILSWLLQWGLCGRDREELPWLLLQVCGQKSQVCLSAAGSIQGKRDCWTRFVFSSLFIPKHLVVYCNKGSLLEDMSCLMVGGCSWSGSDILFICLCCTDRSWGWETWSAVRGSQITWWVWWWINTPVWQTSTGPSWSSGTSSTHVDSESLCLG